MKKPEQKKFYFLILLFFFIFTNRCSIAEEQWQFYRINAQYRGLVKNGFRNVGCGLAWFKDISPGRVQVIAHVCAQNPEKASEVFGFRVNLLLGHNTESVWVVNEVYKKFEGIQGARQNEILQLVCLWDMIRRHIDFNAPLATLMNLNGRTLSFNQKNVRQNREIKCKTADRRDFSGKFFIKKTGQNRWQINKFRFKSGKVAVSMIQDSNEAVSKDFRYRQPFAEMVFDNH